MSAGDSLSPHQFGGDANWAKGYAGSTPPPFGFRSYGKQKVLPPDHPLISTQPDINEHYVEKYQEERRTDEYARGLPRVYRDEEGNHHVLDGHHRLLGDRRDRRDTRVEVVGPEHIKDDFRNRRLW
jgi:hypothetical protein